ncbi:MAG: recombinase family protein [Sarcina sp.]
MKKRIVSYMRVSSASQKDNTSIPEQREKIDLYCRFHDYELVKPFWDNGRSAKSTNREYYKEMMKFISDKENKIDAIVVYKADRIHRSLKNLLLMIEDLTEKKIGFISINEQFDTSTSQGMLFLQMLGSFSEFERKQIAERTYSGRMSNIKNNISPGGKPPLGYKLIDGKLQVSDEEAIIIKQIYKLRSKGKSLSEIGKEFGYTKQRVDYILKNRTYIGEFTYDGKIENNNVNWKVEPIISKYIFNKIQIMRNLQT